MIAGALSARIVRLSAAMRRCESSGTLVGGSAAIERLRTRIERVAGTEATVLILGERGTGKELVARAIHGASPRRLRPFVTVNCAALPSDLLAAELFGHVQGAFTGATQPRQGLLLAAAGGTVLLDEIGDLPPAGQAMLLRFLQGREVRAIGSTATVTVDVRVVAATNRDLAAAMRAGEFRADLQDRLTEAVIDVPPLRERREDIRLLAFHFLAQYGRRHRRPHVRLGEPALAQLEAHHWPGNVRQLEKAVSAAVIFAEGNCIVPEDLGLAGKPHVGLHVAGTLTARQRTILDLAERRGVLRSIDIRGRLGLGAEAVRQELVALVRRGLLQREGQRRWARYRLPTASPAGEPSTVVLGEARALRNVAPFRSRSTQPEA